MNQALYGKTYTVPADIINSIRVKLYNQGGAASEGVKRAKFLTKNGTCTYQMLKRLKNFFDYTDPQKQPNEYELAGGAAMRTFIENTLKAERHKAASSKNTDQVFMPHAAFDNTLNVQRSANVNVNEGTESLPIKGAIAVIVNEDKKALLVKRASDDAWMPGKWALVGGGIEEGEEPVEAIKREIREECGLEIDHFLGSEEMVQESKRKYCLFTAKSPKDAKVKLNNEHSEFGWFSLEEAKKLDAVPNLEEHFNIALSNIENA
jgi:mutator protein MutT